MISVVLAIADQGLARQIQSQLAEMGDVSVLAVAATTHEATDAVLGLDADLALVHEAIGPEPVLSLMRDLTIRRPAVAQVLVAADPDTDLVTAAMEAGARAIVTLPLVFAQVDSRVRGAASWSQQVRRSLSGTGDPVADEVARGRAVGIAGAKGGVGTTTITCHLAMDIARSVSWARVCLIDLDLEKGDVPGTVDVRHRVGVSDLAKVADDLSSGTIADSVTRHESGLDMLLAPVDIHDVEWVTPTALRQVISAVRREYDLVVIDLGSHVTPAQATAVELVDELVLVVTPDVPAVRGMRRSFNAWDSLNVCKERDVRVLVNRVSKQVTMPPDTIRQLTQATVLPCTLPAGYRRLEPAANARDPFALHDKVWWSSLRRVGRELGILAADRRGGAGTAVEAGGRPGVQRQAPGAVTASASALGRPGRAVETTAGAPDMEGPGLGDASGTGRMPRVEDGGERGESSPRSARRQGDTGAVSLEALVVLPLFLFLSLIVWHMAALGIAAGLQANAASAATRAASIGQNPQSAAEASLPSWYADGVTVSGGPDSLSVSLTIEGIRNLPVMPRTITTTHEVVSEP